MSQPKLSVETQTSIYNCLCMPLLDCFRSTKHGMYKKPCPTTPAMLLCEFHHPPISLYIIKNTNLSFKPTLSNNHVQSILFSEARLETLFSPKSTLTPGSKQSSFNCILFSVLPLWNPFLTPHYHLLTDRMNLPKCKCHHTALLLKPHFLVSH